VPERNKNDLIDLPEEVRKLLDIRLVETIDDVLDLALLDAPLEDRRGERRSGGIRVIPSPSAPPGPQPPSPPSGEIRR
jgi:predicted ATP-dependent protease